MDEEEMLHAFDFFYQGKLEYQKGSGLGLSLSKEIIQLHKGCIDVTSKKGKGTTFRILLSTGEDHLSEEEKIATLKESRPDYNDIKIYTTELEEKDKTQVFEPSRELKEQSVLIIEDNEDMLDFLKQKLQTDYEVYTARDGDAGLSEAFEKVPDLILSDIVLPSPSGIEITRILKNDFRTSHIPVILLTAKQNQEQQIEGLKIMADGYITKPFNVRHLTETIKNLLFNRNLLKVHFSSDYPADINLPVPKKLDKKFINDFMRLVENNIANENFSVDDLCRSLGISRIQLYRKVKALLDCNITDYILNRRLHKAKYLLLNEDLSISEITYQVGFSSPAYFSSVFKSKYGCTPTEFKKKKPSLN
jgi:DNA-binding response OmpR family regulator